MSICPRESVISIVEVGVFKMYHEETEFIVGKRNSDSTSAVLVFQEIFVVQSDLRKKFIH